MNRSLAIIIVNKSLNVSLINRCNLPLPLKINDIVPYYENKYIMLNVYTNNKTKLYDNLRIIYKSEAKQYIIILKPSFD